MIQKQIFLPMKPTQTEQQDLIDLAKTNKSFYEVWKYKIDWTTVLMQELNNILYGRIKRNFTLNIKGLVGRQTGVFKSSFGCQLALTLDPTFNIKERVAFTPNQLLDKIKQYATQRQIFLMDERVHDFKVSAEQRLQNIVESCRERQLCFIMCGVPEQHFTFSDYHLERMGESGDEYLTKTARVLGEDIPTGQKTIYYLVKKITETKRVYRGYIKWNVMPLEDESWRKFWEEYMVMKRAHQEQAVQQSLTGFNFRQEADRVIHDNRFQSCFDEHGRLVKAKVKNLIYELYPDNTAQERQMIQTEVIMPSKTEAE
jgi:hypothetical protein